MRSINNNYSKFFIAALVAFIALGSIGCSQQKSQGAQLSSLLKDISETAVDFKSYTTARQNYIFPDDETKKGIPTIVSEIEKIGNKASQGNGIKESESEELKAIANMIRKFAMTYYFSDESRLTRGILETGDMVINAKTGTDDEELQKLRNYKFAIANLTAEISGTGSLEDNLDESAAFRGERGRAKYISPLMNQLKEGYILVNNNPYVKAGNMHEWASENSQYSQATDNKYFLLLDSKEKPRQFAMLASLATSLLGSLGGSGSGGNDGGGFLGGLFKSLIPIGKQLLGGIGKALGSISGITDTISTVSGNISNVAGNISNVAGNISQKIDTANPQVAPEDSKTATEVPQAIPVSPSTNAAPQYVPMRMPFASPFNAFNYIPHYFKRFSEKFALPPMKSLIFGGYDTFRHFATRFIRPDYHKKSIEELKAEEKNVVVRKFSTDVVLDNKGDASYSVEE